MFEPIEIPFGCVMLFNVVDLKDGVTVEDATADTVALRFSVLPENLEELLREILGICPDASDSESEIRDELRQNRKLFLWWD